MKEKIFHCPECQKKCTGGHRLRSHVLTTHFKHKSFEFKEEKINLNDGPPRAILRELLNTSDNPTFNCPYCNVYCVELHHLRIHLLNKHFKNDSFDEIQWKLKSFDEPIREYLRSSLIDIDPTEESLIEEFLITDENSQEMRASSKKSEKDGMYIINDFLRRDKPICREERQYSLLLFNKIKEKKRSILDNLGIKGNIISVFYEATFMRDYWYNNKKLFNEQLVDYIHENEECSCEIGEDNERHANYWEIAHPYARWMMNAKPDIAIITEQNEVFKLFFIECKYYSDISNYRNRITNSDQLEVQERILDFLCNKIQIKYRVNNDVKNIEKGSVILAQFVSEKFNKGGEPKININELLD